MQTLSSPPSDLSLSSRWDDEAMLLPGAEHLVGPAAHPVGSPPFPPGDNAPDDASLIARSLARLGRPVSIDAAEHVRHLMDGLDLRATSGSAAAGVDRFIREGDPGGLPEAMQAPAGRALAREREPDRPSGRLRSFIAAIGRTAANLAHCTGRNFLSVAVPTMVRQAVGRALDLALAQGVSETARTWLSCGCLAVPVVGQAVLLIRDEARGDATRYSRATRVALMALPAGAGLLGASTGTMVFAGTRFAEAVLYPLMRDCVQARWPMRTAPDSGPTRSSLALAGLGYAINQLAVSRVFSAAPDVDLRAGVILPGGIALRGLSNWGGEALDLWTLLALHHACRHGVATQPRMRMGQGDLRESAATLRFWDTMSARGCFVAGFNQLYDSLLDDQALAQWLRPALGDARAPVAADWLTELIVGAVTAPSYLFWTDPLHSRGIELQSLEEASRGGAPLRQYAGNRAEPALPDGGEVVLTAFRRDRT